MTLYFLHAKMCELATLEGDSEKIMEKFKNKQAVRAKFLIFGEMMSGT